MNTLLIFSWQHLWSMKSGAGAPSYHHTIQYYIDSKEWEVYLFTVDETNRNLELDEKHLFLYKAPDFVEKGMKIKRVSFFSKRFRHMGFTKWAFKQAKSILENTPNCYVYGYEVWGIKVAQKLAKKYDVPLITRFQGTVLSAQEDNFINRLRTYPHYEALSTPADLIVMTDDGTFGKDVLLQLGNESKCLFVRNGLDLYEHYEEYRNNVDTAKIRKKLEVDNNTQIIMMASRLASWKRVDRGITAIKEVIKKNPDVLLVIAGDGDERDALERLSVELDISRNVKFLGSVPHKDLYEYMLTADLFMSLYDLGNLGNPTFEAMLMGMTIIALNNGDTESLLHHNDNAYLLAPEDIGDLPEIILKLLEDEELRKTLSDKAYQDAVDKFYTWNTRMEMEEEHIKGLERH